MRPLSAILAAALLSGSPARADEPTPVKLRVGEVLEICKAGLTRCPVTSFLCDDPKVAAVERGEDGAVLKAVSPGTTTCSVLGFGMGFRRVLRVTVEAEPARAP